MARKPRIDTTGDSDNPRRPDEKVVFWLNEIEAAKKREKEYREEGKRVREIYGAEQETPFNILYSNTETLLPSVFSSAPRPVVERRFKDEDPIGRLAAMAGQRVLEFLVDTNVEGYETFEQGVRWATMDALLPGRGVACVKYDAEIGELQSAVATTARPGEGAGDNPGAPSSGEGATPYAKSELVCLDTRVWDRVFYGYAKKWSKVPWIAYEEFIDKKEAIRLFGRDIAAELIFTERDDKSKEDYGKHEDANKGKRKTTCIYQIWDKEGGRKIRYVSPQYKEGFLKVEDDPLELTGFFNQPRPLQLIEKTADLVPVAPYALYENQANELNEISRRINRVVKAIKARGIYDSSLGSEIEKVMTADDNELVPADSSSTLAAEKGIDNAIWFMPIQELVQTLQALLEAREQAKRVVYEITGISDIIRGSTVASETATAQEIKTQWGTLRLKRLQREIQRYARDLLRMMLELAATKFSETTWAKMTGLPFVTTQQRQQAGEVAAAALLQGMPPPPEVQQALQAPQWAQILAGLRDDMTRAYRIDIETNSTIEPEAAEDQKHIAELMTAMGQYLNGVGPLVAKGVMPFGAAQSMLLAISRRFRFGTEIEDEIKAMQPPPPEGQDQAAQKDAELQAAKTQYAGQLQSLQNECKALTIQTNDERSKIEVSAAREKLESDVKIMQLETRLAVEQENRKIAADVAKTELDRIKLECDQAVFAIEKKAAEDKLRDMAAQTAAAAEQANTHIQGAHEKLQSDVEISGLKTQLEGERTARQSASDSAKNQLDAIRLDSDKAVFGIERKAAESQLRNGVQAASEKIAGDMKVRSVMDQSAKREQAVAKSADNKMGAAVAGLQATVEQLVQAHAQSMQQQQQMMQDMAMMLTNVMKIAVAPRRRKAIRDMSGRIVEAIDEPITVQ